MVQWLVFLLTSYLAGNINGRTYSKQQLMKSAMIAVLALMLVYRCGYVHCATVPQDSTDMLALIDFRQAITGDPRGFFNSWNNIPEDSSIPGIIVSTTAIGMASHAAKRTEGASGSSTSKARAWKAGSLHLLGT